MHENWNKKIFEVYRIKKSGFEECYIKGNTDAARQRQMVYPATYRLAYRGMIPNQKRDIHSIAKEKAGLSESDVLVFNEKAYFADEKDKLIQIQNWDNFSDFNTLRSKQLAKMLDSYQNRNLCMKIPVWIREIKKQTEKNGCTEEEKYREFLRVYCRALKPTYPRPVLDEYPSDEEYADALDCYIGYTSQIIAFDENENIRNLGVFYDTENYNAFISVVRPVCLAYYERVRNIARKHTPIDEDGCITKRCSIFRPGAKQSDIFDWLNHAKAMIHDW